MTKRLDGAVTPAILKEIVPTMTQAKRELYAPLLTEAMREFDITTELRAAAFLAQCAHETDRFKTLNEYASGAAYEGRHDLGNTRPGDGKRYKGRGAIQLTGRANYREVGRALGLPLEDQPGIAALPEHAFRIAGYYWRTHGLNELADRRQYRAISGVINAGSANAPKINGLADRVALYDRALRALPDDFKLTDDAPQVADTEDSDIAHEEIAAAEPGELIERTYGGGAIAGAQIGELATATLAQQPRAPVEGGGAHDAPVVVQATAPAKERSDKSLISAIVAFFAAVGAPFMYFKDALYKMLEGAPDRAIVVIGILCGAAVLIYWKYQDRQTRLDIADRSHASDQTQLAMKLTADPQSINVTTQPNVSPAPAPASGEGGRAD